MKKTTLYSRSGSRSRLADNAPGPAGQTSAAGSAGQGDEGPPAAPKNRQSYVARARNFLIRHERFFLVLSAAMLSLALLVAYNASNSPARRITQQDIDAAVLHTMEHKVLPSQEAKAFRVIQRSIVRVRRLGAPESAEPDKVRGTGTGVVIVDTGTILTNLHVVAGADRVQVAFANGLVADAKVTGLHPEKDLAVLQASTVPDDLIPATLRSTSDLSMGDKVVAVGFPFGIGPSVSSGVISGLKREYRSPEGKRLLSNLIQFDAAANPGNSGGPLVTMDGAVVGIVTGILNPNDQGVFIGIAFAVPIEDAASAVGMAPF
jgi:S1-C subfamily serine protease